jgi:hypothetical protein
MPFPQAVQERLRILFPFFSQGAGGAREIFGFLRVGFRGCHGLPPKVKSRMGQGDFTANRCKWWWEWFSFW